MTTRKGFHSGPALRILTVSIAAAFAGATHAQQAPAPARAASAPDAVQLDAVVVTATKRSGTQREQAGSIAVIGGEVLERLGARDQEDTLKLVPGVQFQRRATSRTVGSTSPGRSRPSSRSCRTACAIWTYSGD